MIRFDRYQLRTTDVAAARAFYDDVLGDAGPDVVPLPAEAQARGAKPHWLGHLGVDDVDATAAAFGARGAVRLGPTRPGPDGGAVAVLRDPGGAVMAIASRPAAGAPPPRADVAWHVLLSADPAASIAAYRELCGWGMAAPVELGPPLGAYTPFAWQPGGAPVGSIGGVAGRAGVHTQWLFHFAVAALEPVIDRVRARGGLALAPFTLPSGVRVVACDDPQGGAFGLREVPR